MRCCPSVRGACTQSHAATGALALALPLLRAARQRARRVRVQRHEQVVDALRLGAQRGQVGLGQRRRRRALPRPRPIPAQGGRGWGRRPRRRPRRRTRRLRPRCCVCGPRCLGLHRRAGGPRCRRGSAVRRCDAPRARLGASAHQLGLCLCHRDRALRCTQGAVVQCRGALSQALPCWRRSYGHSLCRCGVCHSCAYDRRRRCSDVCAYAPLPPPPPIAWEWLTGVLAPFTCPRSCCVVAAQIRRRALGPLWLEPGANT